MSALRWTLGIVTVLASAGMLAIAIIGGGFRKSFGGSDKPPIVELVIAVTAGLILASLIWPDRRMLMHTTAVLMVALCIGCFFIARQSIGTASMGLLFAAGWLAFYYRAVWAAATP